MPNSSAFPRMQSRTEIILNVYDLIEQQIVPCCGMYHSGIEILGVEYSFAKGSGVYECPPKDAPGARFREALVLGETTKGNQGILSILDSLREDFHGDAYHVVNRNCNHFTNAFSHGLLGKGIPGYVNRLAWWGSWICCCLPDSLFQQDSSEQNAPLLSNRPPFHPQRVHPPLFQGGGNALGSSEPTSGQSGVMSSISRTLSGMTRTVGLSGSSAGGVPSSSSREVRANAAAARLSGLDHRQNSVGTMDTENVELTPLSEGRIGAE